MKKKLSVLSAISFIIGVITFVLMLIGIDDYLYNFGIFIIVIGLFMAMFAEKGLFRKIGLVGNGFIVFFIIIIPLIVTTFFWNTP
ncbi:hypothetical protein [Cytobacillus sp. IB215665]|uniref:hypothetical protein n=1 Tax=Cytobacillus sp. IB215665 TaxID=3097357 RepID=UPI002A0B5F66|nr:hypothetical protein [Cytobacillus sp. IB215665]MDX8365347.1 hypothetical protein [Cytobacillus sp. IB215665]